MKQLLILSGKGGTGKTTVTSAFIQFSKTNAYADCDVDAPNLHLVTSDNMSEPKKTEYYGLGKAIIDSSKCINCGACENNCRFGAIKDGAVSIYECEGCGVCTEICPIGAITIKDYPAGNLMLYKYGKNVFSGARLNMGSGTSGKLVTEVKKQLLKEASDAKLAIIDGSPGIGCPVIASISGVDMVLIVAEPTISGIHDMQRIIETAKNFGVICAVCINKFDVNPDNTKEIEKYCIGLDIPLIGKIPFDKTVIKAVNSNKSIAEYTESPACSAIKSIWETINKTYF